MMYSFPGQFFIELSYVQLIAMEHFSSTQESEQY